jgi:hypothetical protein
MDLIDESSWRFYKEPVRYAMVGSLLYASYLVWACPCSAPVGCKQGQFYGATLAPAALTFLLNLSPSVRK